MTTSSGTLSWFKSESSIRVIQLVAGAIIIGIVFRKLQFSTSAICCGDFDGYYHIKWTQTLWASIKSGQFRPLFPWLPLTTLNSKDYVDHHLLFHIFQVPFAVSSDPRLGAKIASALFGSLAVLSCYWLLLRYRVRYAPVWLIALLGCSAPFLFRMNMAKAPPFAIVYLVIAIHLFFKRKYWPLLLLGLVFTWTYDLFVLLIMATVFWSVTIAISEKRFEWRPLVYVIAGCALGLIINPYFPHNLQLLVEHMNIKLTASDFNTKVGSEWYPYDSWEFLGNSAVACIAMLVGYIAFEPSERRRGQYPIFFLLLSTALMIMTARWKRIAEYWPPFAVLFAGFSLKPWLEGYRPYLTRLPAEVQEELKPFLDREGVPVTEEKERTWRDVLTTIAVASVSVVLSVFFLVNLWATTKEIKQSEPHEYYQAGAEWMRNNVPAGQLVFNTDWDDFPRLFYFDPSHYYVSGLDPSYLFDKNPDLSGLYDRITLGSEEDPGPLIRDRFGARYVFSDNTHHDFFEHARASGWFDIVYEDTQCTIMYIRDEKLEENPLGEP
jgi:hypothetical protein